MNEDSRVARDMVDLLTGAWRAQATHTAARLGVADHIAAGRTTDAELAAATGSKEDGIHRLMRLLVAMELFAADGAGGYRNTALSELLLDVPGSQRDMALLYGAEFYTAWSHAPEAISTVSSGFEIAYGTPLYTYNAQNPAFSDRFQRTMKAGNLFFSQVPSVYDFAGKHVVDIGGGNGQLLAEILTAHPTARGTLFDQENVVDAATTNLAANGVLDRAAVAGGDMRVSVPGGADVYLLCRVLAGHSDDDVLGVFQRVRAGFSGPHARLLMLDRLVDEDNPTVLPALWDLHLLMTTGGRHRSLDHLADLLDRAGLAVESRADLPVETTALIVAAKTD
ncbi:MAG: acetylserotonin O-methyltransferase [Actinomycetota bacterium]|nr:acetylserotonin O-methyltransferase [Actinomycetota bacterium]